ARIDGEEDEQISLGALIGSKRRPLVPIEDRAAAALREWAAGSRQRQAVAGAREDAADRRRVVRTWCGPVVVGICDDDRRQSDRHNGDRDRRSLTARRLPG